MSGKNGQNGLVIAPLNLAGSNAGSGFSDLMAVLLLESVIVLFNSKHNGRLYQYPVEELEALRGRACRIDETQENIEVCRPFELEMKVNSEKCKVSFGTDLILKADGAKVCLSLSTEAGSGRKQRNAIIPSGGLREIRMLVDTTAVEIYLNHGEVVFSTRYYPGKTTQVVKLEAEKFQGKIYELKEMSGIK